MRVDIEGAVEFVRRATEFDWGASAGDLDRFCGSVGYTVLDADGYGIRKIQTGMDVTWPTGTAVCGDGKAVRGSVCFADGQLLALSVHVADDADWEAPRMAIAVARAFADLGERLMTEIGSATSSEFGIEEGLTWELPGMLLSLKMLVGSVDLRLVDKRYQEWLDRNKEDDEDGDDEDE